MIGSGKGVRVYFACGATDMRKGTSGLGAPEGSWLARMLARQPRMLVAVALAICVRKCPVWMYMDPA